VLDFTLQSEKDIRLKENYELKGSHGVILSTGFIVAV